PAICAAACGDRETHGSQDQFHHFRWKAAEVALYRRCNETNVGARHAVPLLISHLTDMDEAIEQRPRRNNAFSALQRALSPTGNTGDAIFRLLLLGAASLVLLIVATMIIALAYKSRLSISQFGFRFLSGTNWDPVKSEFGALAFVYGTVVSSLIALLIAVPLSLGIAILLVEQAPRQLARPLAFVVELLAAIPSVVYGLWGIFVLAPFLRVHVEPPLARWLGWLPLFQGSITGIGLLTGGIILAIMVTPIISAVVRDVLAAVPDSQREAALALGATKWETTRVVLVNGAPGIAGAVMLGLGRAIGETMAVTMVIGNRPEISASLFQPS